MSDDDIRHQAEAFVTWCSKWRHHLKPSSSMFVAWAASKDFLPRDREAIWQAVQGGQQGAA